MNFPIFFLQNKYISQDMVPIGPPITFRNSPQNRRDPECRDEEMHFPILRASPFSKTDANRPASITLSDQSS